MRNLLGFYTHKDLNNIEDACLDGFADPFIYRFNGYYYLFYTASTGLKSYKSKDLLQFTKVDNHVLERGFVADDPLLKHAYAPEVCYVGGAFYIITSIAGTGHRILKSSNIEGPYKFITSNIHQSIDGSFFIDNDETIYLSRASETGICLLKMNESMDDFLKEDGVPKATYFKKCRMHDWTEGPYILKRYGKYYLTYTGTHFLSDAYRINYSIANDLKTSKSFKKHDLLAISTTKSFYGLGHSMTFLAPNLDSYLIAYHNMEDDGKRFLNINRLMFDDNKMIINDLNKNDHLILERPLFESYDKEGLTLENDLLFTNSFDLDTFSIEFVFKNETECIFSYKNSLDYFYFKFIDNNLTLFHKIGNLEEKIYSHQFKGKFLAKDIHTLRAQYKNSVMAIYIDGIELISDLKVIIDSLNKVAILNKSEVSYLAISKYAFGSSDNEEPKFNNFLASHFDLSSDIKNNEAKNGYLNLKNNRNAIYKIYSATEGEFNLDALIKKASKGTILNISVNGNNYQYKFIEDINGNLKKNLLKINLNKGINEIIVKTNLEIKLVKFEISNGVNKDFKTINYDLSKDHDLLIYTNKDAPIILDSGIYFENDRNFAYVDEIYEDFTCETTLKIYGNTYKDREIAGLNVCVTNYSKSNGFEREDSLEGFIFAINKKYIYIYEAKYEDTKLLFKCLNNSDLHKLKIEKRGNIIFFYLDDKPIYTHYISKGNLRGLIGLYMSHESVLFKNLYIGLEK